MRVAQGGLILTCAVLFGCHSAVNRGAAPAACRDLGAATTLPLPPTVAPATGAERTGPLRFANRIPVNGGVGDIGEWRTATRGWRSWRLRLTSENARSLSVHLQPLSLPDYTELWICGPNGTPRHGPVRASDVAANGYWSPQVLGPELWLEVVAPAEATARVQLKIAEAFAAFR